MKNQILKLTMVTISFLAIFSIGCEKNDIATDRTPAIKTDTIINVAHTSAVIKSKIIDSFKKESIIKFGVCWSTEQLPDLADNKTIELADSIDAGFFASTLQGLNPDTYYYVRAYAIYNADTAYGNSLSFKTWKPFPENGTVINDISGNSYHTITIGNQVWLNENLNTTRFANADLILHHTDTTPGAWGIVNTGAYADYNNDTSLSENYGRLYNWQAVDDYRGLCPVGWHVPAKQDFEELLNYLGGDSVAGGKLKESGTAHWQSPNAYASNESGFTALPAGFREVDGSYQGMGFGTFLWSSTEKHNTHGVCLTLVYEHGASSIYSSDKNVGLPVRCVMDK
jgi:uncharacterized protein (TIGR02145 family)